MIDDFIKKTIHMLSKSDIRIHMTSFDRVELDGEKRTVFIELTDSFWHTKLEDNLIFCSMVFFTLLDTYVDMQYPNLEGYSFAKRYKNLPTRNDKEIMLKETYRILKIFRNATVHSRNAIELSNVEDIIIDYPHNNTKFHLSISKLGLELIYTLVLIFLDQREYCFEHQLGLLRTFYDDIKLNVSRISDEFGTQNLSNISNEIRLKRIIRRVITNPKYNLDKERGLLNINILTSKDDVYDYIVQNGNNRYIIPSEILNSQGILQLSRINKWSLVNDV